MNSHTNCNETVKPTSEVLVAMNIALSVISAVIGVFAVLLNSLVIASVMKTPSLWRPANLWLCSLSLSDLLVGLVVLPLYVAARLLLVTHNADGCQVDYVWNIYSFSLNLCSGASFLQLCLISWDRYKAVSHPLVYRATVSKRKTLILIVTSWLTWATLMLVVRFVLPQPYDNYALILFGAGFVSLPIFGQAATYKAILRHNQQIVAADSQVTAAALAREKKTAITLRYVTFAIFGCLMVPLVVFSIVVVTELGEYFLSWSMLCVYLNSCINPVIYFWRHPDMRAALRSLVSDGYVKKQNNNNNNNKNNNNTEEQEGQEQGQQGQQREQQEEQQGQQRQQQQQQREQQEEQQGQQGQQQQQQREQQGQQQ